MAFKRYPGRFGAVITAMVTPFDPSGALSIDNAAKLAKFLEKNGSDAIVVAGSTGESTSLEDQERLELFDSVIKSVNIPVILSCSGANTKHSIELTKKAKQLKPAGFLVVTPYYIRPSQNGIFQHFVEVSQACDPYPVIVYDIPARTGRKIETSTILRLASEVKNVVGLKDAAGNIVETAKVINRMPEEFELYCGDDSLCFSMCCLGASGVISVASHWCGRQLRDMMDLINKGMLEQAAEINKDLEYSFSFESSEKYPNPMPTKAVMRALGLDVGQCRLPLGNADNELEEASRKLADQFRSGLLI